MKMNEKCGCTGLKCIRCNPGPCEYRKEESNEVSEFKKKCEDILNQMNNLARKTQIEQEKWSSAIKKVFGYPRTESISKEQTTRPSKDEYYLNIALAVSKRSTCLKRHYGCVIVKDDIIVATGYNGSPRGEENCCDRGSCKRADAERYTGYENCDSVHAEQNAIIAASHQQLQDATLYLACEEYGLNYEKSAQWEEDIYDFHEDKNPIPCPICQRMIANSGIVRMVNQLGDVLCL